jgi:hypothetical protein
MTRYYFDLRDHLGTVADEEGMELSSFQRVQEEAARSLADIARDAASKHDGGATQIMAIEVRDDNGPVLNVRFWFEVERMRKH